MLLFALLSDRKKILQVSRENQGLLRLFIDFMKTGIKYFEINLGWEEMDGNEVLYRKKAKNCHLCKNGTERKECQDTNGYCTVVEPSDHLGVRCVGSWGADKAVFISSYVDIVGKALKNKWDHYYYIEICSGPGLCIDSKAGDEINGTALAVLLTEGAKLFTKLFFFDINQITVNILRERIALNPNIPDEVKQKTVVSIGDYTNPSSIIEVLDKNISIFKKGLNIVFVDPTDMSVPFDLYPAMIGFGNATDFIINFAVGSDLNRNIASVFEKIDSHGWKKYSRVLEFPEFFTDPANIADAKNKENGKLSENYKIAFLKSFMDRGYTHIQEKPIMWYYRLVFLSQKGLGKKFWKEACKRTASEKETDQGLFPF